MSFHNHRKRIHLTKNSLKNQKLVTAYNPQQISQVQNYPGKT